MIQNICLVNILKFPNGDAGSVRVLGFAKVLESLGYNTIVATLGRKDEIKKKSCYEGIEYKSFRHKGKFEKILFYPSLLFWLYKNKDKIDVIIGYASDLILTYILKSFCRIFKITLICDVVEWYSKSQFRYPYISYNYIQKNILNKYVLNRSVRIIAISRYLEEYYKAKGCVTVRIPIFFELPNFYKKTCRNRLSLIYAGSPGKKDFLYAMLQGLALLPLEKLEQVEFTIIGVSQDVVKQNIANDVYDYIKPYLQIKGRISREDVLNHLRESDFSVLLRDPNLKVSKAGFPSKVPESMCNGTPLICNYSSDLQDYLIDSVNALICKDYTPTAFKDTVLKALLLSSEEKKQIAINAYKTAEQHFNICSNREKFINILS